MSDLSAQLNEIVRDGKNPHIMIDRATDVLKENGETLLADQLRARWSVTTLPGRNRKVAALLILSTGFLVATGPVADPAQDEDQADPMIVVGRRV
jgi:hypothetical protein